MNDNNFIFAAFDFLISLWKQKPNQNNTENSKFPQTLLLHVIHNDMIVLNQSDWLEFYLFHAELRNANLK